MVYSWKTASDGITTFWMYSQKEDMTYDDRNRLETRQNYSWNSNSGTWDSSTRKNEHFFYNKDNGRIDSVFYYRWDGYEWLDNYEKEVYSYSDDGLNLLPCGIRTWVIIIRIGQQHGNRVRNVNLFMTKTITCYL